MGQALLQNVMYILHCLLTHFFALRGSGACHVLPTICLLVQGLCMCFRCSEASHAHSARTLRVQFTGSLSSFIHTISAETVLYISIIWYLYFAVEWEFIATVTLHFLMLTTALHWRHTFRLMEHCAEDIPFFMISEWVTRPVIKITMHTQWQSRQL